MKIKSLLFAALVAFTASAQTAYTDCADKLTADAVTLKAGESTVLNLNLNRQTSSDFTNIQFNVTFPEGIRPVEDADMECYGWEGEGIPLKARKPVVAYTDNFAKTDIYPNYAVVGVNMNKVAVTENPCQIYCLSVGADEGLETGDYEVTTDYIKYTTYANDSYATSGKQVICTIHVEGTATGINDLQVNSAKTYKTIENGQVIIVKGDVRYNTMGQIVK